MSLTTGARLGPYQIIAQLGSGGMGEVYRARDGKLNRDVALKILPKSFATDPDRLARFRREAHVLASLNHANVGHIYGFEDGDPHALVLELVEGPTLADQLARGPLPPTEAILIARQIAGALEAAHEQGIVHRDLKPANIKIKPDGTVKVLDFGLAKALVSASNLVEGADSPTITALATEMGVVLGTPAYMSPEQAQGKPVDRRADIWAFGAVLFEMLSGRRVFSGDSRSDALAAVLRQDVDWTALPPAMPPFVRRLLARCLDRDVTRRLRDIGEARIALEQSRDEGDDLIAAPPRPLWLRAVPLALSAIVASALTTAAWYVSVDPPPSVPVTRLTFNLPEGQVFTGLSGRALALSPDGTQLAYVANGQLHLRSLSEPDAKPIQGTDGLQAVADPVFSPDGRSLAFHAVYDQTLKRIAVTGGAAVTIAKADVPFGVHWGPDGIVYGQRQGIFRVSPNGGAPELIVTAGDGETADGPQVLPGGRHVLFTLATGAAPDRWNRAHIVIQTLSTGERKTVIEGGADARYVDTGHLVYALGGNLLAVAFDARRLKVTGSPVPMIEGVRRAITAGGANFFVSDSGSLAYVRGPAGMGSQQDDLALIDRTGRVQPLRLPPGTYSAPRVSPDGTRVVFGAEEGQEATVFTYGLSGTSAMRRLTFGGNNRFPIWSSDGTRVAFQSDRDGDLGIFWQLVDGTGAAERLTRAEPGTSHEPESWAPDGAVFLFSAAKGPDVSLWTLSLRERTAAPFGAVRSSNRTNAVFSPDGRWVAYAITQQGRTNTFVEPFPRTGARHLVSSELAAHPLWTPNGKELLYNPRPGAIGVVGVSTTPAVAFSRPAVLPRPFRTGPPAARRAFDIAPDGRFVGLITTGQTESETRAMNSQVRVVLNWQDELTQRVPR